MPYLFTCSHCQTKTLVEDRYSGLSGKCVTCGQPITVPRFAARDRGKEVAADSGTAKGFLSGMFAGRIATAVVAVAIVAGLAVVAIRLGEGAVSRVQEARIRSGSLKNLERIADALRAYAADRGSFPPPMSRDNSGKPLLSWRVLILPYLGEEDLFRQFDLSRPWDSMENQQASLEMPKVYRHPGVRGNQGSFGFGGSAVAAYYLITGDQTLFPVSGPLREEDATDGAERTILVVEATPLGVTSWAEPADLEFGSLWGAINAGGDTAAGGLTDGGVAVATADGRGRFVREGYSPRDFRAFVTPAGSEPLAIDLFD